jgi:glycosyltransferase involved in cell wall biosynthesis
MIYIVDIEAVETRYTAQWKEHLPKMFGDKCVNISGGDVPQMTTPGAFLNFAGTNVYKSKQLEQIAEMFANNTVKDGDYFLYTDAWNPTVIQLKYMAELLGKKIRIGGLWHAGSYDPQDFLGRLIGNERWVRNAEKSMFDCYDNNFFATDFHIDLFVDTFQHSGKYVGYTTHKNKIIRTGWPMEYMADILAPYKGMPKKDIIVFPHRIAPEKQVDIFYDLKEQMPQYEFVVAQERQLTKNEYHNLLGEAKLVFSANLQETLGISWYEGALVDTIPMVPNRLSYKEMAMPEFAYPSSWTLSNTNYQSNKASVVNKIKDYMDNYDRYLPALQKQTRKLSKEFFSANNLYATINNGNPLP